MRKVQLSNSTKLLPIPSGHHQGITAGLMNARFRLLRLFSHTGKILGVDIFVFVGDTASFIAEKIPVFYGWNL
ncbi:hypothetical protein ACFL2E_11205 [Thermodesulfobacteriota bacterium]